MKNHGSRENASLVLGRNGVWFEMRGIQNMGVTLPLTSLRRSSLRNSFTLSHFSEPGKGPLFSKSHPPVPASLSAPFANLQLAKKPDSPSTGASFSISPPTNHILDPSRPSPAQPSPYYCHASLEQVPEREQYAIHTSSAVTRFNAWYPTQAPEGQGRQSQCFDT